MWTFSKNCEFVKIMWTFSKNCGLKLEIAGGGGGHVDLFKELWTEVRNRGGGGHVDLFKELWTEVRNRGGGSCRKTFPIKPIKHYQLLLLRS